MGLIKAGFSSIVNAGVGAAESVFADQWKEFFYCNALPSDVLVRKGQKQTGKRSSNTKGSDNIISNGSGIAVADGQCMIIVEQGKIVEFCAEPGQYTYDMSTEPSLFAGKLGKSILDTFKAIGKRFAYGGDTGKDQRVYYFNTKEILDNKFGTPSPIMFRVVNKEMGFSRTVNVRCNGIYSYRITDPLLFYTKVCGNVEYEYTRAEIDSTLKTEFIDALQPALGALSEQGLRPDQLAGSTNLLKAAMNDALKQEWADRRGITVERIAIKPITLTEEDAKKIGELEDAVNLGSNPFMMAGRMTDANAEALKAAAGNSAGAMTGFLGLGMAMNNSGAGNFNPQQMYQAGVQQRQAAAQSAAQDGWKCTCGATATGKFCPECGSKKPEPVQSGAWKCQCGTMATGKFCPECGSPKPAEDGWTCSCGAVNKGKFCQNCGAKKPAGEPLYRCDKCGWEPEDPKNPPRFCPECGDPFNDGDIQ